MAIGAAALLALGCSGTATGAVTGAAPATAASGTAAAAAAVPIACSSGEDTGDGFIEGDLDGDAKGDVVVGMPAFSSGAGAVDVHYTGRPAALLRGGDVGGSNAKGTAFGASVAIGDLDGDHCADVVIGAPREAAADGSGARIGRVHILFGSPTGLLTDTAITVDHPAGEGDDLDDFGASLDLSLTDSDELGHDLFVGAPGSSVGGHPGAGAVWRYTITAVGPHRVKVTAGSPVTQDSPGVPGVAEADDGFGEKIAADGYGGVIAAAPLEDIGKATDAGAVWRVRGNSKGAWTTSTTFSQGTGGVPGKAETGDRFGSSLSAGIGGYVMVGAPGEDGGSAKDSGLVQVFTLSFRTFRPAKAYTQSSPGIPGTAQAGNRFGAAVAVGTNSRCIESTDAAIGAPGEDVGSRADAGTITFITIQPYHDVCSGKPVIRQGSGLAGAAEAGDRVGAVLSNFPTRTSPGEFYDGDGLLIGVPREDVGGHADAGMVQSYSRPIGKRGGAGPTLTFSGGQRETEHYGTVLSSYFS